MMATTLFLWLNVPSVEASYQTALIISGLVTFIATNHYMRIFSGWSEAYEYKGGEPVLTVQAFNDAYRYKDCQLTTPLL